MSTRWCYCYTNSSALFHLRPYCCLNPSRVLHLFSIVGLYFQLKQHLLQHDTKQKKRLKLMQRFPSHSSSLLNPKPSSSSSSMSTRASISADERCPVRFWYPGQILDSVIPELKMINGGCWWCGWTPNPKWQCLAAFEWDSTINNLSQEPL